MKSTFSIKSYLLCCFAPLVFGATYKLELDPDNSPPASVPPDGDRIYSVSIGHIISKPIIAFLKDENGNRITGTKGSFFSITSIHDGVDPDSFSDWGRLCQYANRREYPNSFEGRNYQFYCIPSLTIAKIPVYDGVLRADGLYHIHNTTSDFSRKFVISMEYGGQNLTVTTEKVEVTTPANTMRITCATEVFANTPFDILVNIIDKDGNTVVSGIDSTLPVMMQVAALSNLQIFYGSDPLNDMIFSTKERLSGTDAKLSRSTKAYYIDQRAQSGVVTFTGVRLLDIHDCVRLNFTMRMPHYPHSRMPNTYYDIIKNKVVFTVEKVNYYYMNGTSDSAVVLSDCIKVKEQTAANLIAEKGTLAKIGANFPIDQIVLHVEDSAGNRIYSGSDSNLTVTTTADPVTACLSPELQSFQMNEGKFTVNGSICEDIAAVTLTFSITSSLDATVSSTATVGPIEVTKEIHLAAFFSTYDSGSSSNTGAFSNSFAEYAVEDINNGVHPDILPGRVLKLHSYDTQNSVGVSTKALSDIIDYGQGNPHEKVVGIVGFGSNVVTKSLGPLLKLNKIPNIATNEDEFSFSDKATYPYYNRLSWNILSLSHSVMMACKNRGWTHMTIVKTVDFTVDNIFYEKAKFFGITISAEVNILPLTSATYTPNAYADALAQIRNAGTRIVWMFVMPPASYYLIREVINAKMGGIDGWQWNWVGLFGWAFPWANQGPTCMQGNITCAQGFVGAMGWIVGYDLTMHTDVWHKLVEKHRHSFRKDYLGTIPKLPFAEILAEYSLAYDAVRLFGIALTELINNNKTITGDRLTEEIRKIEMNESLTGYLKLDSRGERPGYIGVIVVCNPHPFMWPGHASANPPTIAMFSRMIFMENDKATDQLEFSMQAKRPMDVAPYNLEVANYTIAYAEYKYTNKRTYRGSTGRIGAWSLKLEPLPSSGQAEATISNISERSVAPFYCVEGCGGNQTNEYDINRYQFGYCYKFNTCRCEPGYYGLQCQFMTCNCVNGRCLIPSVCVCEGGWTGERCEIPICSFSCNQGKCSGPDTCKCHSGYVGPRCTQSIYVVTIIPIAAFIILIVILVFLTKFLLRRYHLRQALKNLDWLVKWDEVIVGDTRALSIMSTAGDDFATSAKSNMCTWRSQKCYVQKFNCDTLSVEDPLLRREVVSIRELRHNNLITFVGACLEYPNACVLTEVAPKGSLEDLLSNDSVKLGWDFKFSLLKDICRGMHFLHLSDIGSHGRLKSSNCLVDNRWTCKLSGFGLPALRYNGPRKEIPNSDEEPKKLRSLFWTAPELLKGAQNIDDVKCGTKHGDVYSFGIILTEVCTREEPFSSELGFLEPEQVLTLVIDKDAPEAAGPKKLWYKSGGDTTKLFRPTVRDEHLPEEYGAKSGLQKLMAQCWGTLPELRPSFKNVNEKLNEIYPIKGELIDNLVNMLEKYSSNLEQIVAERTKELVEEKRKTEYLISQMLPKKVVEDLKHGNPVQPESFECVTIFFSDIVGFTNIAKGSTPFQVVDLLNDLYTTFDAILDNYDVYKVETIGDAYMIVSGLPIRNGDLHAGEIATTSLDLMASMVGFKIRHMPGETLQLRVGMHSGPCVAGVVGLKMPRYCLFGDTVNTASRMESSSMALRIHMSDACAQILIRLGGYHLDCRGEREVKGKGTMTTWWLNGKDGFDKPLPSRDLAVSASKHEFK